MDITSNWTAPLTLPNGQIVPPRGSVVVADEAWKDMQGHAVVKAWFSEKKLTKGAEPEAPAKASPPALDSLTDEELRLFLKDGGVTADGRWGRDKLLAEAKKAAGN